MNSIAVIITGDLSRNNKRFFRNNFYNKLKSYDLFISTYKQDLSYVDLINKKQIKYLNLEDSYKLEEKKLKMKKTILKLKDILSRIDQWYHLDKIICDNYELLKNYDLIIKVRPDMFFENFNLLKKIKLDEKSIYACTDILFYGKSQHFLEVFSSFYKKIPTIYAFAEGQYLPLNYKNLLESDFDYFGINNIFRLALPKLIIDKDTSLIKEKIKNHLNLLEKSLFKNHEILYSSKKVIPFSTERSFLYHVINSGTLKDCHFKCARPRRFFNGITFQYFPLLDRILLIIKNILKTKIDNKTIFTLIKIIKETDY